MRIKRMFRTVFSFILNEMIKPVLKLPVIAIRTIFSTLGALYGRLISKLRFSITFRITIAYMFIVSLAFILLCLGVLWSGLVYMVRSEGEELGKDFSVISAELNDKADGSYSSIGKLSAVMGKSVTIFGDDRKVLFTTETDANNAVYMDEAGAPRFIMEYGGGMLVAAGSGVDAAKVPRGFFNKYGFAIVANSVVKKGDADIHVQIIDRIEEETLYAIIFVFALLTVNVIFVVLITRMGARASKKILRPIQTMTETVRDITIHDLDTRLDIGGSQNELKDLARTFNGMLDRIQGSYERQNQFVSDASHELRTPISVIQGYTNLLDRWGKEDKEVLEEAIEAIKGESESMKSLVEKLLFLARGDKGTQKLEKEEFNMSGLVDEIVRETRLIDKSHEVSCEKNEAVMVNADRMLLKEALRVFVDNSVKYTPQGGQIILDCSAKGGSAVVTIEDTGVGISKEDLPHVFDRFYRADKSRTKGTGGTGLGLAIAKWIILKHNGTINLQSEVGTGTKIYLSIPAV